MSKHTPWKARCRNVSYTGGDWPEDEFLQWEVEGPRTPWGRGEFYQKDAQLIAESPNLLEACKRLIGSLGAMIPDADSDPDIIFARATIAKAEGEQ